MAKEYERYQKLLKPSWAPPAWLFGPVWSVLYIIIAISYGYMGYQLIVKGMPFLLALPFILNLIFNFAYTPIQFKLKNLQLATIDILLVLATLVWALLAIFPFIRWVVIVNIPYLLWVCFASALQVEILLLNRPSKDTGAALRYAAMKPKVGDTAPLDITVLDAEGSKISLRKLHGRPVVLYAYPKDGTPGCVKEACSIRDIYGEFAAHGISVIGISADNAASHVRFAEKYNLPFPLWSDTTHELLGALGVWGKQKFLGKSYMGIARTTFLIDKNGKITHIWEKVNPEGHAEAVLDFIENLQKTSSI